MNRMTRTGRAGFAAPLISAVLCTALSLALSACGGGDDDVAPVIVAGADTVTLAAGQSAALLVNDSIGGVAASSANVSFSLVTTSLPAGVTADGGTLAVAAAAVPGTTTISYRICDLQRTSNCATAEVRLTVPAPPIVAGADTVSLSGGASADVLANDTLASVAATAATVTVSATATVPANVSLSAAGLLSVAAGATPGVYDIGYSVCQKVAPSNCASANIRLTVVAAGALSGRALDASTGLGIAGITVRAAGVTATTDAGGNFSLTGVSAQPRVSVVFDGPLHAESARIAAVREGVTTDVQVRLLKIGTSATVDVAAGGTVDITGTAARLVLPANGVQRADGSVPTGNMTVKLTAIDPAVDSSVMPGDFTTISAGNAVPIESYGALNVKLSDAAGVALNLRAGQTATLRIPVATRNAVVPATMPLFFYDATAGRWVQEGTATLAGDGSYYEGTVTHFSTWNADMIYDTVRISGCLADASGTPVAGAFVQSDGVDYSGTSSASTGADGKFVLALRKDSVATVVGLSAGKLSNTLRVGPYSTDFTMSDCLVLGQTGAGVTMKLTWGARPGDLDSHLYTPNGMHVYFSNKGALLAVPFANLDVDDTSSYGPEVVTLTKLMVGTYKYSVRNYSGQSSGTVGASGARVELNVPGRSVELLVPPTTGESTSTDWWNLFELDVDAACNITVRRVDTFAVAAPTPTSATVSYCTP